MSDVSVTVGGGSGVTVAVNGNTTTATVTAGGSVQVTLTDTSPPTWSGITGKPTTFPPQAHNHFIADTVGLQAALDQKVELDGNGKVPASQLPSYVDDVLEVANAAALPATGETGKIYVTLDNGKVFRWSGSQYVEISAAPGSTDFVPEGTSNLYHTTARAAAAAPVQSVAGKTGSVTLVPGDVGAAASSHAHGNITSDGKIGTTTAQIVVTDVGGTLTAVNVISSTKVQSLASGAYLDPISGEGQTVTDALAALDSQIEAINFNLKPVATSGSASDLTSGTLATARIGAHASSHQTGGSDAVSPVVVSPASLSASQNNYAPGVCDLLRLSSSTAVDITGLAAGTVDGALRLLVNTNASGGAAITLKHESASSTAANRFRNATGGDYVLAADGGSAVLTYSTAISRWRIL